MDVVGGVEPDMSHHDRDEEVIGRPERRDPDGLAFEITNAANTLLPEKFDAADMYAAQYRDRCAAVDHRHPLRREMHIEIDLAQADRARHFGRDHLDEPDFGETLRAQQLLGDELWRIAQRRGFGESYTGGLQRLLRHRRCGSQYNRTARH